MILTFQLLGLTFAVHIHIPLFGILFEEASQQGLGFRSQILGESNLLHEDELKQTLVVLVVEGQPTAHHLVHDHTQSPPVNRSPVVVVLQHLDRAGM